MSGGTNFRPPKSFNIYLLQIKKYKHMNKETQFTELSKYIKTLVNEYDMTDDQYDLWDDIMEKIKELKKLASKTK
jgi:hypothetical protein